MAERKLRENEAKYCCPPGHGPQNYSINLHPLFLMLSDSNPDDIVEYARVFDAHTVSTVAALLHTDVTDMLEASVSFVLP